MDDRSEQTQNLDSDVNTVRFVHGKRLEGLHELGIFSIRDLYKHFPYRYDDFSKVVRIIDLPLGEKNAILGTIIEAKGRKSAKGGYLYEIAVKDESGVLKAIWFNQRWLADTLTIGKEILLLGKAEHYKGYLNMAAPLYTIVASDDTDPQIDAADYEIKKVEAGTRAAGIIPVYRANNKISSNWIKRIVLDARKIVLEPLDPFPVELRIKRELLSRQSAFWHIHSPASQEMLAAAHLRLAYEQVFWAQMRYAFAESQLLKGCAEYSHKTAGDKLTALSKSLPFKLTDSQKQAIAEIFSDMQGPSRMNRLLLGDVGSGKTVVALHALVAATQNSWQAAMMAPTEVLANQYARSIGSILDKLGIGWTLLTSSLSNAEKALAYEQIADGSAQVVMGTHALIEPDVQFENLSLIIIDEQHRFGVDHRNALIAKSPSADFMSMTATPIPRSLALVLYGSIQASYLANRPQKAKTTTLNCDKSVVYRAYEAIREALDRGEQAYIVCPLIAAPEPQDDDEAGYIDDLEGFDDNTSIAAAEAEIEHLRRQVFPEKRIELLTSRVKSEEKKNIMAAFNAGEVDILVSTTVIEVGVDVPNATVMVILDADRFGLAQLHQLRGRVGRGTKDSQVYLVSNRPGDNARRRLKLLEKNSDGLVLAKADLAERKEGDIGGTRQHGESSLSLINVIRDSDLIETAHEDVLSILKMDPSLDLPAHRHLKSEIAKEGGISSN